LLDVDVLDGGRQKRFFRRHSPSRISKRDCCAVKFSEK
jgi:hypothetical protein